MSKPSIKLAIGALAIVSALTSGAFAGSGPNTNLPFMDDFTGYTNGTPLINGTNGWYGTTRSIIYGDPIQITVQTNTGRTGTNNAAVIPEDCTLSNRFQNIARTNIWIQMDVRPILYDGTNTPVVDTNATWTFYINSNGYFMVHNGPATNPSPTNSRSWVRAKTVQISKSGTNWVQVQIRANYSNLTWDLYADSVLVTNNVNFVNPNLTNFAGFDIYNGSFATSYVDYVSVVQPTAMEVAPASLTNGVMQGWDAASQVFTVSNTGGQNLNYSVTINTGSGWMNALPSSGICAPATNVYITNTYTTAGLANGMYSGQVQVVGMDGWGFFQTNLVDVAMQVVAPPVIMLNPSILTQTVVKGANLLNQEFTIWNGSAAPMVPMAYTLSISNGSPELIRSMDSIGGVSTGQANHVSVTYMDNISASTGVYNAFVKITAWDPGNDTYWPTGTVQLSTTIVAQVTVTALAAPTGVTATDGAYTNQVTVSWNPVTDAVKYKVYRSETFDWTLATPIGESVGTSFNDVTALPGKLYYYWVSSANLYLDRGEGPMSTERETGYRALAAPGGIFATDGAYTDKVRVTWPLVDGATGYQLYRGLEGGSLVTIYFTAGGVYDDFAVVGGVHYEYKVGATNGMFGSQLSMAETGYAFGTPGGLTASDGTLVGKVRVMWNAVESASEYEVWRSTLAVLPPKGGALKIATVNTPMFDDSNVSAGTMYYYWVRGNRLAVGWTNGNWSGMDRGYAAEAGVDLWVKDLVVLPVQVGVGGSPFIVSFRMGNGGGANMAGANGNVGLEFYASLSPFFGTGGKILIGKMVAGVTLGVGADMVMKVDGNQLVAPAVEGDYFIFVRVLPEYPSLLVDTNPDNNVAARNGIMRVRSNGGMNYQVFNDYDGDGISDLGVYRGMQWSIRTVDERVLISEVTAFGGAGRPVLGDLDGDRRADPMVYDGNTGIWQVLLSGSGYMWASGVFGASWYRGMVADYEGVGHGDGSVFHKGNGRWYVLRTDGGLTEWNWGEAGYEPVIGDYDGDGRWDMAVYQESSGLWFIRTLNGQLLIPEAQFGGPGFRPVPGDYDGDGHWDVALYYEPTGQWFIIALDFDAQTIRTLGWGIAWGAPGFEPVMGDYDGDGKYDLGVYQEATGLWYIRSLDGRILAWASPWGGPGYRPIGN